MLVAMAATGCASTMTVSSHVDRDVVFNQYRTYDWGPADTLPTGDPRLDQNPFFKDHVEGAVEKGLAARGFTLASSGTPDLLIHYHANISQRIDVNRVDRGYGYCYGAECQSGVIEYEAGTLVLDFIDSRTNRIVWRGWAQDTVGDALENENEMERQINEAVTRMLARLPPRL
jgi:hypothetical protein